MPKKNKTRKQKILSDIRQKSFSPTVAISHVEEKSVAVKTIPAITTSAYKYLFSDLLKTLLLTGSIIILELFVHIVLKF